MILSSWPLIDRVARARSTLRAQLPLIRALRLLIALAIAASAPTGRAQLGPPVAPPAGALEPVKDTSANHWTLSAPSGGTGRDVLLLPAQSPTTWIQPKIPGLVRSTWRSIEPQADRTVRLADATRTWSFDPRSPDKGLVEIDRAASANPSAQSPWRRVARMPASNHDLSAAVIDDRMYIAGGTTSDFGFPARSKAFDEIWVLDATTWRWSVAAKFARPRIYCATVAHNGKVWVLGGDILHQDGKRRATTLVEILDPKTGVLTPGPDLPLALPAPFAFSAAGRLWIVGARDRRERGQVASLGLGESSWRVEEEGLLQMWALSGAVLDDKCYLCIPDTGLGVFDARMKTWSVIPGPTRARSAQVGAWRGEIWIMGGCDIADWSETRIYNPVQKTWRNGPSLPMALAWGATAVINDQLIVTGGAGLVGPLAGGNYVFSDQTLVLSADVIPATPMSEARGGQYAMQRWSDAKLRGTGAAPLPFVTERIFSQFKFGRLATIQSIPPSTPEEPERLLVAEVHGPVWTFPNRPDVTQPEKMLDLPERFKHSTHTYALAFHPEYPSLPYIYVLYNRVEPKPAENVLARFTVTRLDVPLTDLESEQILMRWPSDGHNGGDVRFGPDKFLYLSTGDGGSPGDLKNMGQRVDVISGGVLRIDVARTDPGKNYAIPADNPFVDMPGVRPEFWAYGLRNPWRMMFSPSGELWAGDNGDDSWESVHLIRKGHNYGWSVFEGTHPFRRTRTLAGPKPQLTPPVIELSHAEARSVIGGLVYTGTNYATLAENVIFGDFVTGTIWAFTWDGSQVHDYRRIAETRGNTIAFGTNRRGEILLVRDDGQIHRLVESSTSAAPRAEFPSRLSQTGIFADTGRLIPAPGVLPYAINAGLWSNGALVRRHLALSGAQAITPDPEKDEHWLLPDGSAVARTLEFPTPMGSQKIETQVMYREKGAWQFYTYAWNAGQTDAELVSEGGETRDIAVAPTRSWRFSGRSECAICHTAQTHFTIGLTTPQLNCDVDLSSVGRPVANQITSLTDAGLLRLPVATKDLDSKAKTNPMDLHASVENRARSYLDINCAHCHRAGGVGGRAAFQLIESIPLAKAGLIDGQPLVPLLGPASKIITPGHPERSEIFHRITLKEGGRMPLIGSEVADGDGISLLRKWILEMPR